MSDLIDRIAGINQDPGDLRQDYKIHVSQFLGRFVLVASGDMTGAEASQDLSLVGDEITDMIDMSDVMNAKPTQSAKLFYIQKIFSVGTIIEEGLEGDTHFHNPDGTLNKALARSTLEI